MAGFAISPSTNALRAGGGSVVVNADGSVSVTPASGTGVLLGVAPPATANKGLLSLGNGPFDGTSAGHFAGSASGTALAINATSGSTVWPIRAQVGGIDLFTVDGSGNSTLNGNISSKGTLFCGFAIADLPQTTPYILFNVANTLRVQARSAAQVPWSIAGAASQTGDLFQARDSANLQFAIANAGSGASPVWALRVRAVANAESMVQSHTAGAATGRAIQIIDDAGVSLGWLNLTA